MATGGNNVTITVSVNNNTAAGFSAVNNGLNGLQTQVNNTNGAFQGFWRDSNGRLRDAQGRFASAASGMVGSLTTLTNAAGNASGAIGGGGGMGGAGGGLSGALGGVGAIVAASALPALGALAPIMVTLGGASAVVSLAMDDIKKEAQVLKPALEDLQKAASKAIMPGVKSMFKDLKVAMKEAEPAVTVLGKSLGRVAEKGGQFAKSPAFQKALLQNVKLGSKWFEDFGDSVMDFTQSFLDFGAKSEKTLDAVGGGINDVLGKGLPGMFKGLEKGIEGSAEMFDGLFDAVNTVLPPLGRFAGQIADTFGPVLGEAFRFIGEVAAAIMESLTPALEELEPITASITDLLSKFSGEAKPLGEIIGKVLGHAIKMAVPIIKNMVDFIAIALPLVKDLATSLGGPLFGALMDVFGLNDKAESFNGSLENFSGWVKRNEGTITEGFRQVSQAIIDMVIAGITHLPDLLGMWKTVTMGILDGFDVILSGSALAFGWIPGLGDKLTSANKKFDSFKTGYGEMLDSAISKSEEFKAKAVPALEEQQLKLDISNFDRQIKIAKKELEDPNLTRERKAKLNAKIEELLDKKKQAQRSLDSLKDKTAKIKGDKKHFDGIARDVSRKMFGGKSVKIKGEPSSFWGTARSIAGTVVGSAYVRIKAIADSLNPFKYTGGIVGQAASGGARSRMTLVGERGPELVDLAPGSRVRSNDDTRRLFASGGVGGGGDSQPLVIQLNIGDRQLGELVIDPLRKIVRSQGGNVQAVIGT
jgi:hypothetical protein